jgi:hypothetical protein
MTFRNDFGPGHWKDDGTPASFTIAQKKIDSLLNRMADKNLCACCVSRALALFAAGLAKQTMGREAAAEVIEEVIIAVIIEDNPPASEPMPSIKTH